MRKRIKRYDEIVAFRLSSGTLKGLELMASKQKIDLSEVIRNCVNKLLERKKR